MEKNPLPNIKSTIICSFNYQACKEVEECDPEGDTHLTETGPEMMQRVESVE